MTISGVQKSADAFRTISEVAETLKLPQHVLRFWETRFTQIKPMKRAGGRRFYRPEDVELLGAIRQLLYGEGYTIKGVQRILKEQGPRAVALLARQHGEPTPFEPIADDAADPPGAASEPLVTDQRGVADPPPVAEAAHPTPFSIDGLVAAADAAIDPITRLRHVLVEIEACREMLIAARG